MSRPMLLPRRQLLGAALGLAAAGLAPGLVVARRSPSTSMRVYEAGEGGDGQILRIARRAIPTPGPSEVLIRVHATGLNARDLSLLRGMHIYGGANSPRRIPLDDNAGEVLALGAGVTSVAVGDRVMCTHFPLWVDGPWDDATMSKVDFGVNTDGFLAEQALVSAQGLVKIPDSISYNDAATLPNAGLTAWHAVVVDAKVQAGESVLTLGTGGVSVFGLQWARMLGARLAITSSSDAKLERMRSLGADITVNYRSNPNWHQEVIEKTGGRGVDVVLNTVGISEMERCLQACASNGRVMLIGANSVRRGAAVQGGAEFSGIKEFPRAMIMRGLTIKGVIVGSRRMLEALVSAAAARGVRPVIARIFPFEQAADAVRYMESGEKIGKIVIKVT